VVNHVFDFLDGRSGQLDISIDTTPVKAALKGDAGRRFARLLAADLPVRGRAADFKLRPGTLPVSRPSDVSVDRAAAIIQAGLPAFASSIPDTLRFDTDPWFGVQAHPRAGGPRFHLFGALLAAGIILLLIAGGLLTAAAFIGGETRFERLQWFGWPLLAPAAGVLLLGLLVTLVSFAPWMRGGIESAQLQTQGFSASFVSALIDAVRHVVTRAGVGFLAVGGIGAGISLGLLAGSWSIPREQRKKAAVQPG
jgi:hypothetical protein